MSGVEPATLPLAPNTRLHPLSPLSPKGSPVRSPLTQAGLPLPSYLYNLAVSPIKSPRRWVYIASTVSRRLGPSAIAAHGVVLKLWVLLVLAYATLVFCMSLPSYTI